MLEKEFHIAQLISKKLQGDLSEKEEAELNTWLQASAVRQDWFNEFNQTENIQEKLQALRKPNENAAWNKILNTMHLPTAPVKIHRLRNNRYKFAVAAMLLLTLSVGAWFYFFKKDSSASYARQIAPGKNTATLVLANGRKIRLSDATNGKLATEAGVSISKTSNGQLVYRITDAGDGATMQNGNNLNTLSTARGEQYQVILPDSTKVWLNAASSIQYPASFAGLSKRILILSGEAYFEVAKDKQHPFLVKTSRQQIEVLGTHFNVNSYEEENTSITTLLEGRVQVAPGSSASEIKASILQPGEQALNVNGKITVGKANIESALDWHRGDFVFNDDDFRATMRKIARWYNIEVVFEASAPQVLLPGGWVSRSKNLAAVLNIMELTGKVHFKVEGRRVTVTE